jgi:diaminopimelate epimerase
MIVDFAKYHGAGNDFIIIDNRTINLNLNKEQIARLCHRRFGIGADGLMLLHTSPHFDFKMSYYNSDGAEGSMCGNGGRCITAFANEIEIIGDIALFEAVDGLHTASINKKEQSTWDISLAMNNLSDIQTIGNSFYLNTGSPHHIDFCKNIDSLDVFKLGKSIRNSAQYQAIGGTNVNFVQIEKDFLKIRTYERGVEDETLACGTGATAAAIAYAHHYKIYNREIKVNARGGELRISFDYQNGEYKKILLSGAAQLVFKGKIDI